MITNWKTIVLCSLVAAATVDQSVRAQVSEPRREPGIDNLGKQIKSLANGVSDLESKLDKKMGDMETTLAELKSVREELKAARRGVDRLTAMVAELDDSIGKIRNRLDSVEAKLGPLQKRDSMYLGGQAANTGRVVLVNNYSTEITFIVNNVPYRVRPHANRPLDNVPAGPLSLQAFWGQFQVDSQITTLASGETFTLTAN